MNLFQEKYRVTFIGIGKNTQALNDISVLIQLFGNLKEFLTFDEVPLALNPLPPEETAFFKAIFEEDFSIQKISIAFKHASGMPLLRQNPQPSKPEFAEVQAESPPEWTKEAKERSAEDPTSHFILGKVAITATADNENWSIPSESGKEDLAEMRMEIETAGRKIGKPNFYPIKRREPWKA